MGTTSSGALPIYIHDVIIFLKKIRVNIERQDIKKNDYCNFNAFDSEHAHETMALNMAHA
jgi:hypothetical protein